MSVIIESTVKSIPCKIRVDDYYKVKGSYSYNAPSDFDYRGYEEINYTVLDRKGYEAPWLEKKIDELEDERIKIMISDYYDMKEELNNGYYDY
mgnify:CR=1 FL=1